MIEQLGSAAKGVGQCGGVLDDAIAAGGLFVDHESATHRVVLAATELQAGGVEGAEDQAVGVEGQRPADEGQLRPAVERDRVLAEQAQFATLADRRQARRDAVGIHRFGCSPSSPSSTALSLPWPLPVAPSEPYSSTLMARVAVSCPSRRRPSAKRRAARIGPTVCELDEADTDLEQVEDTEGRGRLQARLV